MAQSNPIPPTLPGDHSSPAYANLEPEQLLRLVRSDFVRRLRNGERVRAEEWLRPFAVLREDEGALLYLLWEEMEIRGERGEVVSEAEYATRCPQQAEAVRELLTLWKTLHLDRIGEDAVPGAGDIVPTAAPGIAFTPVTRTDGDFIPQTVAPTDLTPTATLPGNLSLPGYRVLEVLGRGGMGVVYKAGVALVSAQSGGRGRLGAVVVGTIHRV